VSETALTEPVEFKNDQVHAIVIHKPACRIELKVKAVPSLIERAKREAAKAVGKEVVLPGFRKGKAPDELVLKKFPKEVEKETHGKLADLAFAEAQKLAKVPLLNNNARVTFDLQKMDESGAELLFSFETEPKVPSVDPKRFSPKAVDRHPVGEKEIEEAIRQMRYFFAKWTPIDDRPIQENDYVLIDLDTVDGETVQRVFHQIRFEVSKERMAEWMQRIVLGAKSGDTVEGISEPDANASEEERKEFAPKKVRIHILKVEAAELPPLDEEFAKKVGSRDLEHMRETIVDMLNKQADGKAHELLREQVNDFLVEEYPFDIPQSLAATEKEHRFRQLGENPEFRKDWDKMSQDDRKAFDDKMTSESAQAVRLFYLSRQVVRDAQISITHKEVQDEAVATLRAHGMQQQISIDQIPKEVYALALSKIILARAQDYIIRAQKA